MKVLIFTKKTCPKCPPAKDLAGELEKEEIEVYSYDLDNPDGLAEAAMFNVMSTPSVIVVNNKGDREIKSWRGSVPSKEEVTGAT